MVAERIDRQHLIKKILDTGTALSRLFNSPDLEHWRELSVPMAQLKCLFLICNRFALTSRVLAKELGVTPGNITGIVDRLAEQGLVVRKPDPQDRRVIRLEATPQGSQLLNNLIENHTRKFGEILEFLEVGDLEALDKGLKGVFNAVEKHREVLKNRPPPE